MVVAKMLYFALLSVSWIVSGRPDLSPEERHEIALFQYATDHEPNWTPAYNKIGPELLDIYLSECVEDLNNRVETHLNHINPAGNHPGLPVASDPYEGLPKIVYLIRYSNIRILNEVKSYLGPRDYDPLLAEINDEYVAYISTVYQIMKQYQLPIETYLIDVAVLYLINNRMLNMHHPFQQPARLRYYQDMIQRMHHDLGRFLQTISHPFDNFQQLEYQINALAASNIRGYERSEIQAQVYRLAHRILYVIVIYGSFSVDGSEMIYSLLSSELNRAVRRFLNLDPPNDLPLESPFQQLLLSLDTGLLNLSKVFQSGHPWFERLRQMVKTMMGLGNAK
jgi:hypothetical protein